MAHYNGFTPEPEKSFSAASNLANILGRRFSRKSEILFRPVAEGLYPVRLARRAYRTPPLLQLTIGLIEWV